MACFLWYEAWLPLRFAEPRGAKAEKLMEEFCAARTAKELEAIFEEAGIPNQRCYGPEDIINDMLAGLNKDEMRKVLSIVDRKEAIKTACMLAQPGDAILVAGKGHENYQDIKGVKHHFDDKEVIREIFANE